jgi:hypothetical protein
MTENDYWTLTSNHIMQTDALNSRTTMLKGFGKFGWIERGHSKNAIAVVEIAGISCGWFKGHYVIP